MNKEPGVTNFLRALINCLELIIYFQNQNQFKVECTLYQAFQYSNTLVLKTTG